MSYYLNISTCARCDKRQQQPTCFGACPCTVDGKDIDTHARSGECPLDRFMAGEDPEPTALPDPPPQTEATAPLPFDWAAEGARMWRDLHNEAQTCDLSTPAAREAARYRLDEFSIRIPCGECKIHWVKLVHENPPDLTSNEAYYLWSLFAHNLVNRRLKKPWWLRVLSPDFKPTAR